MNQRSHATSFETFRAFVVFASAAASLACVGGMNGCGGEDPSGNLIPSADASVDSGGNDAGGTDSGDRSCTRLGAKLAKARAAARACEPGGRNQCGARVEDECCPISVTDRNSDAVRDFEAAFQEYLAGDCRGACALEVCKPEATRLCVETSDDDGVCAM